MANYIVTDTELTAIADAIRLRSGSREKYVFPFDADVRSIPVPYGAILYPDTVDVVYFNTEKFTDSYTTSWMLGYALGLTTADIFGQITISYESSVLTATNTANGEIVGRGYCTIGSTDNYWQWGVDTLELASPYQVGETGILGLSQSGKMNRTLEYQMFSKIPHAFGVNQSAEKGMLEAELCAQLLSTRTNRLRTTQDIVAAMSGNADVSISELDVEITSANTLTLYLTPDSNTNLYIDWGEGTGIPSTASSPPYTHTYSSAGQYTIRIKSSGGWAAGATNGSTTYGILGEFKTSKASTFPALKAVRMCPHFKYRANGFFNCTGLSSALFTGTILNYQSSLFKGCSNLTTLAWNNSSTSPNTVTTVISNNQNYNDANSNLVKTYILPGTAVIQYINVPDIVLPQTVLTIDSSSIADKAKTITVTLPSSLPSLYFDEYSLSFASSLTDITIYGNPSFVDGLRPAILQAQNAITLHVMSPDDWASYSDIATVAAIPRGC